MVNDGKVKTTNLIKSIFKVAWKILYDLLIVVCVLLILVLVLQKITDSSGSLAGYRIFRVVTGSMLPQYEVGEVVICKETEAEQIKVGDDIVYRGVEGQFKDKIIMHEVVEIETNANNQLVFRAKGISNAQEDPTEIKEDQIYGVVKFKSQILTVLYKLASGSFTSFIIIIILAINVFISFKASDKNDEEIEQLEEGKIKENSKKIVEKETEEQNESEKKEEIKEIEFEEIDIEDDDNKRKNNNKKG